MKWRDRVLWLLGAASPVALFWQSDAVALGFTPSASPQPDEAGLFFKDPAASQRLLQLAGHRSHSSHSSHRSHSSHSSHYSGSGGYNVPSAPPAPATPRYVAPPQPFTPATPTPGTTTRLSKSEIENLIQQAQLALIIAGFDPGPADGKLGAQTIVAIKGFQKQQGLKVTGALSIETLQRLGITP